MRTAITEGPAPTDADAESSARASGKSPPHSAGSSFALRNWRVRTRLIALILIPTVVAVLLGAFRVTSSISSAAQYERVRTVAQFISTVGTLIHDLQLERDEATRYAALGRPQGSALAEIRKQHEVVDKDVAQMRAQAADVRESLGDIGKTTLDRALSRLTKQSLDGLRQNAVGTNTQLPPLPTMQSYVLVIQDLLALYPEITQGTVNEELSASTSAVGALAREQEEQSQERALLGAALVRRPRPGFEGLELDAFNASKTRRESEHASFENTATQAQRQFYSDTVNGLNLSRSLYLESRALLLSQANVPLRRLDAGNDAERWFKAAGDTLDQMHTVEEKLTQEIIGKSDELQSSDQGFAALNVILVVALLVIVLVVTSIMARSLVRPLRRLRSEALEVAGHRLPHLVQQLRESDTPAATAVEPIGVNSNDEIGEVARAFDEVHREAVRLAGDEAALRSNVSAMFVNLSRRTQTLVERQISLIDGLEQGEQDEGRLSNLFKLDHLATRMRRNSENLLVLAGQEPARRWSQPVPLVDVVRASLSEVESYERVDTQVPPGVSVAGLAVNDVIHLLAELVENAISFSSRDTKVIVTANRIDGGGVMIGITDNGIGMTGEELSQANWRLSNPPVVDVSVSRRMGLFVVGRLALRHGIRVQLRPHDAGGLTAMVLLPEQLIGAQANAPYASAGAMSGSSAGATAGSLAAAPTPAVKSSWDRPAVTAGPAAETPGSLFTSSHQPALEGRDPQQGFGDGPPPGFPSFGTPPSQPSFGGASGPQTTPGFGIPPIDRGAPAGQGQGFGGANGFGTPPADQANGSGSAFGSPSGGFGGPSGGFGTPPSAQPSSQFGGPPTGPIFGGPGVGGGSRLRGRRFDFPDTDVASTGPMPKVHDSPMEQQGEEFLPIFAAVESAWFRRAPAPQKNGNGESTSDDSGGWRPSSADVGWQQAAAVVKEPVREGKTASGLPKRVPKANLVPGSVDTGKQSQQVPPMPTLSPDRARSRLSSFQQGIRQGRAVARGELSEDDAYPAAFRSRADDNKEDA